MSDAQMSLGIKIATREELVREALSWIGTPYHKGATLKGIGADCCTFPYCVYKNCGIVRENEELVHRLSQDWFCQADSELYLLRAMRYSAKIAEGLCTRSLKPEPGNFILSRCVGSKRFNHGGIVVKWPTVVHAVSPEVETACVMDHRLWSYKEIVILDPWAKAAEDAEAARQMERAEQ